MWTVTFQPAKRSTIRLASISVECPANLRTDEDFGLLVGLWCQCATELIAQGSTTRRFRFGFFEGDIIIDHKGGRILNRDRLEVLESQAKVAKAETEQVDKGRGFKALLGFTAKFFGIGEVGLNAEAGSKKSSSKSVQKHREQSLPEWRVANADYNIWRVSGISMNENDVLEHHILGSQPICYLSADMGESTIEAEVSYRCDLSNLWFARDDKSPVPRDHSFNDEEDERNRVAISSLIVAAALNRNKSAIDVGSGEGVIILARQKFSARRL